MEERYRISLEIELPEAQHQERKLALVQRLMLNLEALLSVEGNGKGRAYVAVYRKLREEGLKVNGSARIQAEFVPVITGQSFRHHPSTKPLESFDLDPRITIHPKSSPEGRATQILGFYSALKPRHKIHEVHSRRVLTVICESIW